MEVQAGPYGRTLHWREVGWLVSGNEVVCWAALVLLLLLWTVASRKAPRRWLRFGVYAAWTTVVFALVGFLFMVPVARILIGSVLVLIGVAFGEACR